MRKVFARAPSLSVSSPFTTVTLCQRSSGGSSALDAALRKVTHSECAAVPSEALHEAVRLASEGEEHLALVLRHIEENVCAPARDWRRIHGALALLDRLLKPKLPEAGSEGLACGAPIGKVWFEAKIQERLIALKAFEYADDPRVAVVVRKAAATALASAERCLQDGSDDDEVAPLYKAADQVPEILDSASPDADAAAGGSAPCRVAPTSAPQASDLSIRPTVVGCSFPQQAAPKAEDAARAATAAARDVHRAAAALDALNDSNTRWSDAEKVRAGTSAPQTGAPTEQRRSVLCCCMRRRVTSAEGDMETGEANEGDSLIL
eukprot:gnl/TRDRNA2_/TRDRNA2_147004_c3_seq1.p1 gnl/TRDRNA2_/TRDRNA2_147004_c3~~gnl/TRDRNA2_/TRDRNA2_147004_c3_seq1.p1  ORF type:complete len:321 (+),score=54.54 gnl/TRDRNA2_/TRDRNA2_147004_c3_seq1:53-1015(+)